MTLCRVFILVLAVLMIVVEAPAQLPPAMQADRYLVEAERHIETGDQAAAQAALDRILALQAAHDVVLPEAFWFQYAQVAYQAGLYAAAVEAATRYLTTVGRDGAHYRAVLELLDRAEAARQRIEAERQAQLADEAAYAEARRVDTAAAYNAYLAAHPHGRHAAVARVYQQARAETERLAQLPHEMRNSIGMEFVLIGAGTFQMGSPVTEPGRWDNEGPVHEVTVSHQFYLGKYEVTQAQWQAVMGSNPSIFSGCGSNCPVEQVSWEDTQTFIAALNRREGVETYRLPTEAEWEYAARAGTQTAYSFGNTAGELDRYAWYGDGGGNAALGAGTHPVGQKRPNAWGLFDLHGNVQEWVQDWYGGYPHGAVTDPRGPSSGARRVFRGGSWNSGARYCRSAFRDDTRPGDRSRRIGFRLARTP